jgi:transcriptional regulator with XRE-family HTH domain
LEWAQVRALVVDGISEREIARRLGMNRRTVARLARSEEPPRYRRAPTGSQLDRLEPVLQRLLEEWPQIKAPRRTEILRADYGYTGSLRLVQPTQLLPLLAREPFALAAVDLRLHHPAPQRLRRHLQVVRDRTKRATAHPIQAHRLLPELRRELFPLRHADSLPGRHRVHSRGVNGSGSTPPRHAQPIRGIDGQPVRSDRRFDRRPVP